MNLRIFLHLVAAAVLLAFLPGCESTGAGKGKPAKKTKDEGQLFEVNADYTPFYRNGPQQRGGPDLSLERGRMVRMLKRSFGYSQVELDNGMNGYVSTEDLRVAQDLGLQNAGPGLFGGETPLESSAIVEHYRVGPPENTGLKLQPNSPVPEPLLPTSMPGPTPAPEAPTPSAH